MQAICDLHDAFLFLASSCCHRYHDKHVGEKEHAYGKSVD